MLVQRCISCYPGENLFTFRLIYKVSLASWATVQIRGLLTEEQLVYVFLVLVQNGAQRSYLFN